MLVYILIFIIGLCFGSFLNVLISRLDREEGMVTGRSHCPRCKHILAWYDLVPLLSFLYIRGKCRYCKSKISWQYPLVESITAILLVVLFRQSGMNLGAGNIYDAILVIGFLALAVFDYLYLILPDKIVFSLIALALTFNFIYQPEVFSENLLVGLVLALILGIIYLVSAGEWMGFGDVKLVLLIGLALGYPIAIAAVVSAIWLASIVGLVLVVLSRANFKTALPLGTFLSVATILSILFYQDINLLLTIF
jgi:leader peptidase (prepilin peptidase) / N-methyltransferase